VSTNKKNELIKVRISSDENGRARARALKYFKGDLSKWVRWCLQHCPPPRKKKE
jgi:hypothetical protein